jgi:hypothetical protein
MTQYNGWTNYETWCIALHLSNEQCSYSRWRDQAWQALEQSLSDYPDDLDRARADATGTLAHHLKDDIEDNAPDLLSAAIGAANYHEIARHYVDDIPVYAAGWNMPGYMPDNPPEYFTSASIAVDYLREHAEDHAEGDADGEPGDWSPNRDGEFGMTFNGLHYWVQEV